MTHITQAQPRERPILFQGDMVRALLAGTKTQTRRVAKGMMAAHAQTGEALATLDSNGPRVPCPYGAPGDRLWVRESWSGTHEYRNEPPSERVSVMTPDGPMFREEIWYWADGQPSWGDWERPRPSIHMPRWASRILLEITEVRVERLNEISEADCWAEGIEQVMHDFTDESQVDMAYRLGLCIEDAKPLYAQLWESINGVRSWDANPWVWCVSFRVVKP